MSDIENKKLQIRNSTAEFLIFTAQSGEQSIEVRYQDESIWQTFSHKTRSPERQLFGNSE